MCVRNAALFILDYTRPNLSFNFCSTHTHIHLLSLYCIPFLHQKYYRLFLGMAFLGLHKKRTKDARLRNDLGASASSAGIDAAGETTIDASETSATQKEPQGKLTSKEEKDRDLGPKQKDLAAMQNSGAQQDVRVVPAVEQKSAQKQQQPPQYPWSRRSIGGTATPFPRYGHSTNKIATKQNHVLIFGGLRGAYPMNDLWMLETGGYFCLFCKRSL